MRGGRFPVRTGFLLQLFVVSCVPHTYIDQAICVEVPKKTLL